MMNILVTDGENRSSLAVTRSLGRKGYRVVVTGEKIPNLASSSKFCAQSYLVPDPLHHGTKYFNSIEEITIKEKIDVIFPMTDQTIALLNRERENFSSKVVLACPTVDKMAVATDKVFLFHLAQRLDVAIPWTLYLSTPEDLSGRIEEIEQYPVVVKPAFSRIPKRQGFLTTGVRYAASREELEYLYANNSVLRYPSMIQEKVVGPGTGLFTLFDGNRHLALFSHRRLREKPPSGGVSVVSESVPLDEEMVEAAGRLLSEVGWTGIAMVEFKRDIRDNKAKLMEINGRFWGSLQLAITSGIDFPVLLLRYMLGDSIEKGSLTNYTSGLQMKWLLGTLDYLLIRLRNQDRKLNLPPCSSSRFQSIIEFFKIKQSKTTFDVFDSKDILPFINEFRWYLADLIGKKKNVNCTTFY